MNGTLVGNLFAELSGNAEDQIITLRINIDNHALVLSGKVTQDSGMTIAHLTANRQVENNGATEEKDEEQFSANLVFDEVEHSRMSGRWYSSSDHAGTFVLLPGSNHQASVTNSAVTTPSRNDATKIVRRTKSFPNITIYRDEIKQLTSLMKALFDTSFRVLIHAGTSERDIRKLDPEFWDDPTLVSDADFLYITLSEPGELPRSIEINLGSAGCSLSVTGTNDVWVSGCFHELEQYFSKKNTWLKGAYERHALNFNSLAFIAAITLMPNLELLPRIFFITSTVVLMLFFKYVHMRTTSLRIVLNRDKSETKLIDLQRLLTSLLGASIVAFVPLAYTWLSGDGLKDALEWLLKIVAQTP